MPGPDAPQRVTLLYRGVRLGAELLALLGEERQVDVISSPSELARGRPPADVVVVEVPAQDRRAACEQVRRHHRGPLIVLLDLGDSSQDLPPDHSRTLLTRPFSMRQLSVALAVSAPARPSADPAGVLRLVQSPGERSSRPESGSDMGRSMVAGGVLGRVRSWRKGRLVRVSAISVTTALIFVGALAVANQGDRCGPGCDELTGTDLTAPSSTTGSAVVVGPEPTDPVVGMVGPTTNDPSVSPAAEGGSPVDPAGSGNTTRSTATAWSNGAPSPTSPPEPGPPRPTAAPTTRPTTTRPRTSTSTSTSTSTTTTTTATTTTTGP